MSTQTKPEVVFLNASDANTKLRRIVKTVQEHFFAGDKVLILVPNQPSEEYIDQLLWRMPEDSFIPHVIANTTTDERVVITSEPCNFNQARIIINLKPEACEITEGIVKLYEFMDESTPQKAEQSRKKVEWYGSRDGKHD